MDLVERIIFRLSKKDHLQLKKVASSKKMSVSGYLRQLVIKNIWGELEL